MTTSGAATVESEAAVAAQAAATAPSEAKDAFSVQAWGKYVLISREKPRDKSDGGVIIPDTVLGTMQPSFIGTVEHIGADALTPDSRLAEVSELSALYDLRVKMSASDQPVPEQIDARISTLLKRVNEAREPALKVGDRILYQNNFPLAMRTTRHVVMALVHRDWILATAKDENVVLANQPGTIPLQNGGDQRV